MHQSAALQSNSAWSRYAAMGEMIAVLWLTGIAMRITLLAIPPIIPDLQQSLGLSATGIGLLTGLPTFLFAAIAIPGAAVIARIGVRRTILLGLIVTALAGAARALSPGIMTLFGTTLIMSAGIAILQPAMPSLARQWAPKHVGAATAVYSNGMLGAEAISAAVTLPIILPWLDDSWRGALAFWSLPVVLATILFALYRRHHATASGGSQNVLPGRRWWPNLRDPLMWKLGLVTGGGSAMYFAVNSFLPVLLTQRGHAGLITAALAAINLGQVPPTLILMAGAKRMGMSKLSYVLIGLVAAAATVGILLGHGTVLVICSGVIGFCGGFTITLGLALPALLAPAEDVHRLAGAMLTVGYLFATVVPIIAGIVADASGTAASAFIPVIISALIITGVGATIHTRRP